MKNTPWAILLLGLLFFGCILQPSVPDYSMPEPVPGPEPTPSPTPEPVPEPEPAPVTRVIPSGSLIMFYTESLGSATSYVPISEGTVTIERDSYGVVGYIPLLGEKHVLYTFSSLSYSKAFAYPITRGDRLFIIRESGDPGEREVSEIQETDPLTGAVVSATRLSPMATSFAIVGNKVYYRSGISTDLYGRRSGGGQLFVQNLGTSSSQELLAYGADANSGTLYGIGNTLVSVVRGDDIEVRRHGSNGQITSTLISIPSSTFINTEIYAGETALYLVGQIDDTTYEIYRIGLDGSDEGLLEVGLEAGESAFFVDEEGGKLVLSFVKNLRISSLLIYDPNTGNSEEIILEQTTGLKTGHHGDQYLFLD